MGALGDFFGNNDPLDFLAGGKADVLDIFGRQAGQAGDAAAQAQEEQIINAITEQRRASQQGLDFLEPFSQLGLSGVDQASFLTDPQERFDFLQNNPLFQSSLNLLDRNTAAAAASGGRLSFGDTAQQFQGNALLAAQPLLDRQSSGISNLLNFGSGIARAQANTAIGVGSGVSGLMTDIGNVRAGGIAAQQQAQNQGTNNALQLGGALFSAFSDPKLKENIKIIGKENGFNVWSWTWNKIANEKFNLFGDSFGVMVPEVMTKSPKAVSYKDGFGQVNYSMIGVAHGN